MRITTKGQVTLPIETRERFGLLPHTEGRFVVDGDGVRLVRSGEPGGGRGRRSEEHLKGRGTVRMTTDEIMALTRGGP